jgi:flagellar hook assembly protein FlgD
MSCLSRGIAVLDVNHDNVGIATKNTAGPGLFLQNYPNPFKYSTSISFSIPDDGYVSISIYDITGRIVRNLAAANYQSGTTSLIWNSDDNLGRPVKPGIYMCRLTYGNQWNSIRLIVQ